jgi:hypothetical protein
MLKNPDWMHELKETNPKAYFAEIDCLVTKHYESGVFAGLKSNFVRTCMFCRSRKGRAPEALAACKCFTMEGMDECLRFTVSLSAEVRKAKFTSVNIRENPEKAAEMLALSVRAGYVPVFNTVNKNLDQIGYMMDVARGFGKQIIIMMIMIDDMAERRRLRESTGASLFDMLLTSVDDPEVCRRFAEDRQTVEDVGAKH